MKNGCKKEAFKIRTLLSDILVIGCGPAGLLAALEARRKGCTVIAIDKGLIGHECSAVGAKQLAATGPWSVDGDCPRVHYDDTLISGCGINDAQLARLLTEKIGKVVIELQKLGMPLERNDKGRIVLDGPSPGHSKARSLYFSDITGRLLVQTLLSQCIRFGVELYSECIAVELIMNEGVVGGTLVYDLATGEFVNARSKAVIITSGGLGQLYELTSNPTQTIGDGIALALRAGAELMDMEFVQFYPVTVLYPNIIRGMNLNSHYIGAQLLNSHGERFMSKYFPKEMEHVTRDKLSLSIFREIKAGNGGPHGGVFVDATMIPADVYAQKIPTEWKLASKAGVDLTNELLEVAPSAHYFMGGIRIDPHCRTTIPGLFAAGECTAGVNGANRLANNGLSEALVFGMLAGENAAKYALGKGLPKIDLYTLKRLLGNFNAIPHISHELTQKLVTQLQSIMTRQVGIERNEGGLKEAIEGIKHLNQCLSENLLLEKCEFQNSLNPRWNSNIRSVFNLRNMTLLAEVIANSSLIRTESRGAHYRSDYPERDDSKWLMNIVVNSNEDGVLHFKCEKVNSRGCFEW